MMNDNRTRPSSCGGRGAALAALRTKVALSGPPSNPIERDRTRRNASDASHARSYRHDLTSVYRGQQACNRPRVHRVTNTWHGRNRVSGHGQSAARHDRIHVLSGRARDECVYYSYFYYYHRRRRRSAVHTRTSYIRDGVQSWLANVRRGN